VATVTDSQLWYSELHYEIFITEVSKPHNVANPNTFNGNYRRP